MKHKLNTVLKVAAVVGIVVFFYALGYSVGHSDVPHDYSDSVLIIDELTIKVDDSIITLKGFKSVTDGRYMQELLKLLAEVEMR